MTDPDLFYLQANGTRTAVYEWGKQFRNQQASLVLIHATGFHARCWDQVIKHLGNRHIIAIDQRGHGRSEDREFDSWADFADDLRALLPQLDLYRPIAIGHSMGGFVAVAAQAQGALFEQLILIDPVITEPSRYQQIPASDGPDRAALARRRNNFKDSDEMFTRFKDREPYSLFHPQALADYCQHALQPAADGEGMVLACNPYFEAGIYISMLSYPHIHKDVAAIRVPVTVMRAMLAGSDAPPFSFKYSPTWPELAEHFKDGHDIHLPQYSHFLPLEAPQAIAQLIIQSAIDSRDQQLDSPPRAATKAVNSQ